MLKIKDLLPDEANFNTGTEFGNSLIDKSLSKFGAGRSILLDKNNRIIAGNKTIENAAANGFNDIVVVETTGKQIVAVKRTDIDLNTKRGREMALADNATAKANISWDAQALTEWEMPVEEWGIDLSDITEVEPAGDADAEPQIDKAAELNKKWGVVSGDLWQIGEHRLLCGSCKIGSDAQRLVGDADIQLCLTDPPYGQNQEGVTHDDPEGLEELIALSTENIPITNGLIVAFQSPRTFPVLLDAVRANGYHFERMLWLYKAAQCTFPWRGWILKSESILVASKGDAHWQDVHPFSHDCYYLSEVSGELAPDSGWHGSVKPIKVVSDLLARTSTQNGNVYEPFAGSGTTLVACQNLNRKCYAIEISENYCAVILERMATAFPELEIKRIDA